MDVAARWQCRVWNWLMTYSDSVFLRVRCPLTYGFYLPSTRKLDFASCPFLRLGILHWQFMATVNNDQARPSTINARIFMFERDAAVVRLPTWLRLLLKSARACRQHSFCI